MSWGQKMPIIQRFPRYFSAQRQAMEQKISTEEGKTLRMNRSIQAEGVFADTKTDLQFRRFMLRGKEKVGAEWSLLAMAYNILRMHHKAQNERLGTHLFAMKKTRKVFHGFPTKTDK